MKKIVISLFALSLLGTLSPVVTAQDNQDKKDDSVKQDAKDTGKAAGTFGKNTGKVALGGTKKGLSKAGSVLGKAAHKVDKGGSKGNDSTTDKNTSGKSTTSSQTTTAQ